MAGERVASLARRTITGAAACAALLVLLPRPLRSSGQQSPTFKTGTTLVEVSAIVTRDGATVTDLSRERCRCSTRAYLPKSPG